MWRKKTHILLPGFFYSKSSFVYVIRSPRAALERSRPATAQLI